VMLEVNSGNTVGDNMWLWRADHTVGGSVTASANPCSTGLIVNGDDVMMYGLAVEHTLADLVEWNGDRGQTYFYQSELPYDVTQANFGDKGYVGYRVSSNVTEHKGFGIGVYTFMRDNTVTVEMGISCPPSLESSFVSPLSVFLNGKGTMSHIINDKGAATGPDTNAGTAWYCSGTPPSPSSPTPSPAPSTPTPSPPAPSTPTPSPPAPTPASGCSCGSSTPCKYDPSCASGGLGCDAQGKKLCRFCGFGAYASIPCV